MMVCPFLLEKKMSEELTVNSKEAVNEYPDIRKKHYGRKFRKRNQVYQEIEGGMSMWNEKSYMYKRVAEGIS